MIKFHVGDIVRDRAGIEGTVVGINTEAKLTYRIRMGDGRVVSTEGQFWERTGRTGRLQVSYPQVQNIPRVRTSEGGPRPHPLHTPEFIADVVKATGRYPGDRYTGRSTAIALRLIAEAIESPRKPIPIRDHYGTSLADRYLRQAMQDMVDKLDLKHMVFTDTTITFGDE